MSDAVLFSGVTAGYRDLAVLQELSLTIGEGEMLGVIGPNGSGKTTLLRVVTGLVKPTVGAIRLFGRSVEALPAGERARLVGVVPQEMETPMAFSVEEIVMMGRTAALSSWRRPSEQDRETVQRAMAYTDMAAMAGRPFSELSGGERQRAVIAMVLAQEPRLILMDEPTSHLDINHRLEVMQIVERLNRDRRVTVVLVSHDLNLASEFCGRLALLDHGRLVAAGTPIEVLREDTLRDVYHCEIRVREDPADGTIQVAPPRRLRR